VINTTYAINEEILAQVRWTALAEATNVAIGISDAPLAFALFYKAASSPTAFVTWAIFSLACDLMALVLSFANTAGPNPSVAVVACLLAGLGFLFSILAARNIREPTLIPYGEMDVGLSGFAFGTALWALSSSV
jgi:hypothetical protein